jgi:hypothetical protein
LNKNNLKYYIMTKFGKWLGGGLGWAFGGPIGAIIGFAIGTVLDDTKVVSEAAGVCIEPISFGCGSYKSRRLSSKK